MNDLGIVLAILFLMFLFSGEPDVWDAARARIINGSSQCEAQP